jgi:SAM-dependent methyltransferase
MHGMDPLAGAFPGMAAAPRYQRALPYSQLAATYDRTIGIPFFLSTRRAFRTLVRRYGIRFGSAADLGCGTGLFAAYLSRCWRVPVFAVDRSPEMLQVAACNCRGLDVRLLQQDIRCLRLPCPVDLVTANYDTLNHLVGDSELRLAFHRIAQNLRPGGHFFFDLITTCAPLGVGRLLRFATVAQRLQQRIQWEPRRRRLSILVTLRSPGEVLPTLEAHQERAYSPAEVARWLSEAGFVLRGVHDAATLRVADRCPPRLILLAQKRG